MGRDEFRLQHYAGEVNYNVNGMSVCMVVGKPTAHVDEDLTFFLAVASKVPEKPLKALEFLTKKRTYKSLQM